MRNTILDTKKEQLFKLPISEGWSSPVREEWVPQSSISLPPLEHYKDSQNRRKRGKAYIFLVHQMIHKIKM